MAFRFHHELLARARVELGLTQDEAARAVGVDVRTYRRYESGEVNDGGSFELARASRRRVLSRIARELGIAEADLLVGDAPAPARPLPTARHFVGRHEELARLDAWLDASVAQGASRVLAIVALGGAGKTSLVARAIRERTSVFVHPFYEEPRVDAFFDDAAAWLEADGRGDRVHRVLAGLAARPDAVLVLDGLELLQSTGEDGRARGELDDPRLVRLFRAIARGKYGRILVTTRFPLVDVDAVETIALPPLDADASAELLRRFKLRGRSAEVIAAVGGHALSLAVTASYAASFLDGDLGRLAEMDLRDAARDEPLARRLARILDRYATDLAPHERDVLAHVSLFPRGIDAIGLARIPKLAGVPVEHACARLVRRGLATTTDGRVSAHPFVREHFRALVVDAASVHDRERERARARLELALEGQPLFRPEGETLLDACEALFEHTLGAGRVLDAVDIVERAMGGFEHLGLRLGELERGLRTSRALHAAKAAMPPGVARRVLYDLGLYAAALGDLDAALNAYRTILEDDDDDATTHRTLAYTLRLRGDFAGARQHVVRSLGLSANAAAEARGRALLGAIATSEGKLDEARAAFADVRALGDVPTARRAIWEAELLLATGEVARAKALTIGNLAACARREWAGHAAHCETVLGRIAIMEGRTETAAASLARARTWTERSHEVEIDIVAGLLAIAMGDESERERVRDMAVAGRYGLYLPMI